MDDEMRRHGREAVARLDHVIARGADVEHVEVQAAASAVIALRNTAVQRHRHGAVSDACLDSANALVSLVYGAEFPLSGLHRNRFRQTRDGVQKLLDRPAGLRAHPAGDTPVT